jgi:hypothetical protein
MSCSNRDGCSKTWGMYVWYGGWLDGRCAAMDTTRYLLSLVRVPSTSLDQTSPKQLCKVGLDVAPSRSRFYSLIFPATQDFAFNAVVCAEASDPPVVGRRLDQLPHCRARPTTTDILC